MLLKNYMLSSSRSSIRLPRAKNKCVRLRYHKGLQHVPITQYHPAGNDYNLKNSNYSEKILQVRGRETERDFFLSRP